MEKGSSPAPAVCPHPPMVSVVAPGCDGGYKAGERRRGSALDRQVPFRRGFPGLGPVRRRRRGGFAVGAWWVYCFLSRREGDQRKAGNRRRPIP